MPGRHVWVLIATINEGTLLTRIWHCRSCPARIEFSAHVSHTAAARPVRAERLDWLLFGRQVH